MSPKPSHLTQLPTFKGGVAGTLTPTSNPLTRNGALHWLSFAVADHTPGGQVVMDGVVMALSLLIAFMVRFDGVLSPPHLKQFFFWLPILVVSRLLINHWMGVYHFVWKFVCLSDTIIIARSLIITTGALLALRELYPQEAVFSYWLRLPLGIIVPEFLLCLSLSLTVRASSRMAYEELQRSANGPTPTRTRVILYGAGRAGALLAHELMIHSGLEIVGFVDDDSKKIGTVIEGIRVLGTGDALENIARRRAVNEVVISIAATNQKDLTHIISKCRKLSVNTRIVPSAEEVISGRVSISHVREVRIEDLLGRRSITVGEFDDGVRNAYEGKRILVTGAGGSIGSELTRQLLLLKPATISILDKDENSIFELEHELKFRDPKIAIEPLIADIKIRERALAVIGEFRPEVVFHAAAHKHVPLMEKHPCEAVLNNVMGTKNVLEICSSLGTERFVFISSDKAVNPVNVMGATKRVGEKLLCTFANCGSMRVASVRFGNVMGSRGSMIPLFQRQIAEGGPVTVTHPDIVRFFMTIPEAVQLVLCAGSLADHGKIFVLDMGNPRRILDMARQMIELAGLEPEKDIPIAITGLRPGEKMHEELVGAGEEPSATAFEKIFEICPVPFDEVVFRENIGALILAAKESDPRALSSLLSSMGLGYAPAIVPEVIDPEAGLAYAS